MKITECRIKVRDLVAGYSRDEESGEVVAYGDCKSEDSKARLNIRPKYQREFVYKDKQRNAVIETIFKGFPLNTMYWVRNTESNAEYEYEVLDGQQRTISICEYYKGDFSLKEQYFHTLPEDRKETFLNYGLMIYVCEGEESEKLEWFRVINIAGERLTEQELRNAIYASVWLSDAKRRFSKTNSLAEQKGGKYLNGSSIRQEFLESALAWIVGKREDKAICEYMAKSAKDCKNADELWGYFCAVIDWVEMKFPTYRKEMKGIEWGLLYNEYKDKPLDKEELEKRVADLMADDEVQKKSGIYAYVLSGEEKHLNLRAFEKGIIRAVYEAQGGICPHCKETFAIEEMEADHIKPWSKGGKSVKENCQMLCRECNRRKSDK
ncbi:DUF262 domain-containing protein [Helicobacter sp. MIT 21-1697]|uniref:HNH endonuclease family protein n=1 Tax=Helicobacter sp. MIT 21-1697 TaxID=2993733 RepID=UPI00224B409F|nr:DUF262 domain-containing protein [Helicobacter sp. MIT 21-1697]MCX2717469.1 DUF262 domain-containing protein [Helicobacter sp. MIT 21-1697]